MLTGSTSGLKPLLALSSQSSCTFLRNSVHSATSAPARNRFSSTPYHLKTLLKERNRSGSLVLATNSYQGSSVRPTVVAHRTPFLDRPSVFSGMPTPPADETGVSHVDGDSLLVTQDPRQYGRVRQPHRALRHTKRKCPAHRRRTLLWVMLTAKSPDRAWAAYQELLLHQVVVPPHLLHQLVRLLASIKPRTRTIYLQLLSVLKTLQKSGGRLRLWQWNTLIDCAGKQWHKTRLEDYENSLDIFNKKGVLPAGNATSADESLDSATDSSLTQQDPDIWTYNILLSIASRTTFPLTVRHASSLLLASGLPPNRYTHLCLLRYFAVRKDLRSVRATLRKMKQQGLEIGLDGINACLWAYAHNGRFDVALRIYRVLRNNVGATDHDTDHDAHYIRDITELDTLDGIEPDKVTYTLMIQALAYHGDLRNALGVFVDMLSTPSREAGARTEDPTVIPVCYKPSMAAFRGLFLGFARHGQDVEHRTVEAEPLFPSSQSAWDLETLETIFDAFLGLPSLPKPTDPVVYWILSAFDKTSGNDAAKLREVWTQLEVKYGGNWGGRLEEIRRSIFASDDGDA